MSASRSAPVFRGEASRWMSWLFDWTRYDPAITDELERYGRSGVPLYLLYSPTGEVTVLPQRLTNGIIRTQ